MNNDFIELQKLAKKVYNDKNFMNELYATARTEEDFKFVKQGLYRVAHYPLGCWIGHTRDGTRRFVEVGV